MAVWDSNTKWRQGHLLSTQALCDLKLLHPKRPEATIAIVVSHDCDLSQAPETEPVVEIIVGCEIDAVDGNYAFAKSPRTLHMRCTSGTTSKNIEIVATAKVAIKKSDLAPYEPESEVRASYEQLVVLQRWLSARYYRSAFPDEFNRRRNASGIEETLKSVSKKFGSHIRAVFFDIDEGAEVERSGEADTYQLNIVLIYDTDVDEAVAETETEKACALLEAAFNNKLCPKGVWKDIELQSCMFMSDEAISWRQAQSFKEWRAENVSLKSKPHQPSMHNALARTLSRVTAKSGA